MKRAARGGAARGTGSVTFGGVEMRPPEIEGAAPWVEAKLIVPKPIFETSIVPGLRGFMRVAFTNARVRPRDGRRRPARPARRVSRSDRPGACLRCRGRTCRRARLPNRCPTCPGSQTVHAQGPAPMIARKQKSLISLTYEWPRHAQDTRRAAPARPVLSGNLPYLPSVDDEISGALRTGPGTGKRSRAFLNRPGHLRGRARFRPGTDPAPPAALLPAEDRTRQRRAVLAVVPATRRTIIPDTSLVITRRPGLRDGLGCAPTGLSRVQTACRPGFGSFMTVGARAGATCHSRSPGTQGPESGAEPADRRKIDRRIVPCTPKSPSATWVTLKSAATDNRAWASSSVSPWTSIGKRRPWRKAVRKA
ncbi:hypothetical protein EV657_103128 [Rhodovulum visakhapatnamense]|uniref:Uncharacterized protein n=1 Tax=Rhodovulum visakhapatnamense TaxID=364297 RepID=A0A4R8FZG8_9RHOB|nr:hypothetical protein EV657_103128 [Rhodovulum visakhapatnamense]